MSLLILQEEAGKASDWAVVASSSGGALQSSLRILWLDLARERDSELRRSIADGFKHFCEVTTTHSPLAPSQNAVIVCHLDIPTRPSLEILRRFRFAYSDVPVIAIVADRSSNLLQWFLQMRVWDVLVKPCSSEHLLCRLKDVNHPDPVMRFTLPRDAGLPVLFHDMPEPTPFHTAPPGGNRNNSLPGPTPPRQLTPSETRILALLRSGHNGKEIARRLHISYETVRKHQKNIYRKLGVNSALQAVLLLE